MLPSSLTPITVPAAPTPPPTACGGVPGPSGVVSKAPAVETIEIIARGEPATTSTGVPLDRGVAHGSGAAAADSTAAGPGILRPGAESVGALLIRSGRAAPPTAISLSVAPSGDVFQLPSPSRARAEDDQ